MNRYVVDNKILAKASQKEQIFFNILCKFVQQDTCYRICFDSQDMILSDYYKVGLQSELISTWIGYLTTKMERVSYINVVNDNDVYLSVAEQIPGKNLITIDKDYYYQNYPLRVKGLNIYDEIEAEKKLEQHAIVIEQINNGNNNKNNVVIKK